MAKSNQTKQEWGYLNDLGGGRWFTMEGTEEERELVQAVWDFDKEKVEAMLKNGIYPDRVITKTEYGEEKNHTALGHLVFEKPFRPYLIGIDINNPITAPRDTYKRVEQEKKRKMVLNAEIKRTSKLNQERSEKIKEMIDLMFAYGVDIVPGHFFSEQDYKYVRDDNLRSYIRQCVQIEDVARDKMHECGYFEKFSLYENTNYRLEVTTACRRGEGSLEERLKKMVDEIEANINVFGQ